MWLSLGMCFISSNTRPPSHLLGSMRWVQSYKFLDLRTFNKASPTRPLNLQQGESSLTNCSTFKPSTRRVQSYELLNFQIVNKASPTSWIAWPLNLQQGESSLTNCSTSLKSTRVNEVTLVLRIAQPPSCLQGSMRRVQSYKLLDLYQVYKGQRGESSFMNFLTSVPLTKRVQSYE